MPATAAINTASDLIQAVSGWNDQGLARRYVTLLRKAAHEGYPVGMREETAKEHALSDWEAAACLPEKGRDGHTVHDITETREALCREADLIVRTGSRKGKPTYRLNEALLDAAA